MIPTARLLLIMLAAAACRGERPRTTDTIEQHELDSLITALMPVVSDAAGMAFRETPRGAVRSKDQVRAYLLAKLAEELPAERLEGITAAYRLMGLLPDTLDVGKLFVDLYTEQVAGFYEPDSAMFFAVTGTDRLTLRGTLAHEMVHALQHQHLELDSILSDRSDADRMAAAQAVLEGQATLVMLEYLAPDSELLSNDAMWMELRDRLVAPQQSLKVFNAAPLVIRTGLIFPYLEGSTFMRWFNNNRQGELPFGDLMPTSTEQILHPARYQRGDAPIRLRFTDDSTGVMHEDTFGEYESLVLRSSLAGITAVATDLPLGWGGDRLRVYRADQGPALVWYTVFDEPGYADSFAGRVVQGLNGLSRVGYRTVIDRVPVGELAGVRVVIAPDGWERWRELPAVERL
ncbi:MAG TPA: hypothetical protein PLL69_04685, partial [Gemmatimonadales bacterium]|nr:hypothetical protein [Gemmatimonadales bacterium]